MTQWVENPTGGRDRGPSALLRAWAEILIRPRRFFRTGVAPGDQAPGLVFAAMVVLVEEASRFLVVDLARRGLVSTGPFLYPAIGDFTPGIAVLALLAVIVFVTPATVHLTAALQTLLLLPVAPDRGGVSETVQVMCYAMAPCLLAGLPSPELRVLVTAWGAALYVVGTAVIHDLRIGIAAVVAALPAAIVFGYGFRGFDAAIWLLGSAGF
ncbi:YIP1 family protein [Halomicroarcula sp. S1AR25-4]|uniref:YIP1 family protein n=1 Tax=Haloarcula sp. S1AR25-4 TaxID=2950538 RepID=UPI0028758B54|nr:YIP1 family protein [Halomicroarcula sp. S1AR25-4]MDS0276385.1 YIP1 family protein [Halomicroarcula sp. S1AR25-4]